MKVTPKNLCENNFSLWSDFEQSFVSTEHSYVIWSLTHYT